MKFIAWLSALACACCAALAIHYSDLNEVRTAAGWASASLFAGIVWLFASTEPDY